MESLLHKVCWVCLAEKSDMYSMLNDKLKVRLDSVNSPVTLQSILSYVVSSEILFHNGPHFICKLCKNQACSAYKFKKRCELSINIFQNYGLKSQSEESKVTEDNFNDYGKDQKAEDISQLDENKVQDNNETSNVKEQEDTTINLSSENNIEVELNTTTSKDDNNIVKKLEFVRCDEFLPQLELHNLPIKEEEEEETYIDHNIESTHADLKNDTDSTTAENENMYMLHRIPKIRRFDSFRDRIVCSICGLEKSRGSIRQHMLRHKNIKNHKCPYCDKLFNDKSNLNVHIRIHTGDYPYLCKVCGKAFIQSAGLKAHQRVHDDVRPFKCHICDYGTRTSSHLQLHIRRHAGIKNHQCKQCEYSACSKAELKYHMATHSDDKCHICKVCGKGFTRVKSLRTHEKAHSGEKPHICEICGRGFTQAHSLRSHLRNLHKNDNSV